ncbi:MAG: hypothetical protein OXF01_11070 [Gemmatimonadetes bacterium]|nr:hypothetical protein [Gemmatimonadota bacterium]
MRHCIGRLRLAMLATLALAGCDSELLVVVDEPSAPRDLDAYYYAGGVDIHWRTGAGWNGETFLVYGKRASDREHFFIAEVTSCIDGDCVYRDVNVLPRVTYEYYVSAYDEETGLETASSYSVEVHVPDPIPPAVPEEVTSVALDNSAYVHWDNAAAGEADFAAYRVYLADTDGDFFLGETDSPGFIDLRAENGLTYTYYVTSVDDQGHESDASQVVACTPRPDYTGEVIYSHRDDPERSGFRFREAEELEAVMDGNRRDRHFRIESDMDGVRVVPASGVRIYPEVCPTTSLKCGPGADEDCVSWELAPTSGYSTSQVEFLAGYTYMFRVPGDDGEIRFGSIRANIMGFDQDGRELVIFDWAYQTQAGNPRMSPAGGGLAGRG